MSDNKTVLITGGAGTIGQEITRHLLESWNPEQIIIFSRNEVSQVMMKAGFLNDHRLRFIIGDIRDEEAVYDVCRGVNIIFHLAAIKHVGICEKQPGEAIKTNIIGSSNIIRSAIRNGVKRVINMSTDKAVNPLSLYGHTKAIGEKLFLSANGISGTQFMNIRSGNVFGSSGSVVSLFISQIRKNNEVTITDGAMTRYFVSLKDIAGFLMLVMEKGEGGNTYIMTKKRSFRLSELIDVLIAYYGNDSTRVVQVGAGQGEKVHEELFARYEKITVMDEHGNTEGTGAWGTSLDCCISKDDLEKFVYYDYFSS